MGFKNAVHPYDFTFPDAMNSGSFFKKVMPYLEKNDEKTKLLSNLEKLRDEDPSGFGYFFKPKPRLRESESIWKTNSKGALMDASDGLAACLIEISEQSHLQISIDIDKIPKDEQVPIEDALYGGEDFELVGVFPNVPEGFTEIGNTEEGMGINLVNTSIKYLSKDKLFRHF